MDLEELTAIEYMKENYNYLENNYNTDEVGMKLMHMDFLKFDEYINYYDYVIGNPPFSKGQDIEHFYKMYEVCKPGGIVTCIMSVSWLHNSQKKFKAFRKWLGIEEGQTWLEEIHRKEAAKGHSDYSGNRTTEHGNNEQVLIKTYPAGTFKESGTNVITCIIQIEKNDISGLDNNNNNNDQFSLF